MTRTFLRTYSGPSINERIQVPEVSFLFFFFLIMEYGRGDLAWKIFKEAFTNHSPQT